MAYIALYRKYRPQTFTDVVGQHQVSDTLMRAIREDKVAPCVFVCWSSRDW